MSQPYSFTAQSATPLLACLALFVSSMTQAATLTWSGAGANDNWSTTANWGGSAPVAGDVLTFAGMTRLSPVNDLAAGTEISGILFPNNYAVGATGAFSISGASFILGGNISSTAAAVTGGPFTIADSISNDIVINATRTITTASAGTSTTQMLHNLTLSGVISESGGSYGLTKSGAGTLTLSGLNTFTGPMGITTASSTVAANTLAPSGSPSSIGAGSQVNLAANSSSLTYTGSGNVAFNRQITLNPGGNGGILANNGTGVITYTGTFGAAANSTLAKTFTLGGSNTGANDFQAVIANAPSGTAPNVALTKTGDGAWTLSGLNTYLGTTTVNRGTLNVSTMAPSGSPSSIGAGTSITFQNSIAVLNYTGSADVTLNRNINLNSGTGGTLSNNGIGILTYTGTFTNADTGNNKNFSLRGGNTGANTFQAVIADNSTGTGNFSTRFTKTGTGTWTLAGLNTYTGTTTIEMGRLQVGVAGVGTTGTGAVTLQTGATLNGTGTVKGSAFTAQTGTTIHAGDSTAAGTLGTLSFDSASGTGSFNFQSGSTVQLDLTASGTSDTLSFTGTGGQSLLFNGNLTVGPTTLTPTATRVYQLLSWTGLASTTFASRFSFTSYLDGDGDEPAGLDLPNVAASIYTWDISNLENDGSIALILRPTAVNSIMHATAAPAVNGFDVANLVPRAGTDKWWAETNTEAGKAKGQTFRIGNVPLWLRAITYRIAPSTEADPTKTYVVRVGKVTGSTFTALHSETFTQTVTLTGQRYVTWRFANPVLLTGDATYGIDVGMTSTTVPYTTGIPYLEYSDANYADGEYYSSGGTTSPGAGTNSLTYFPTRDRVFHLDIEAPNGSTLAFIGGNPADNSTNNLIRTHLIGAFNQNLTQGTTGNIRIRDITNTAAITTVDVPITDPRITIQANNLYIATVGLIDWNKKYAIQVQSGALLGTGGTPFTGWINDTTWNFNTAASDPLLTAIAALKNHLNGTAVLTTAEITTHSQTLAGNYPRFNESVTIITALFDLITTHETEVGALFVVGGTSLDRDLETNDIPWTIYRTMEAIMDRIYTPTMLAQYESTLNGYKFATSSRFPGACAVPPAGQTNTVSINASFPDTFGRQTQMWTDPARKATGSYLSPGTIATVTVPTALVNKGYQIRVGCHSLDNANRPLVRRIDRCTLAYDIKSTVTKIASPLGGGIYIDVPLNANAGVVSITIVGAARSPFFSALPHRMTTLSQWQTTERTLPGPWADFQTEKVLIQVPRSWIYAYADPVTNMANWDKAMDAMTDLMGFPNIRGKETMYDQVDLQFDSSVYSPGYPTVNNTYSPTTTYNGNHNHFFLTGPRNSPSYHFHEPGHAFFFPKHDGETESAVNLPHVAIMTQKFGVSFDTALADSIDFNAFCTLPNTAVTWMTSFNFSPRKNPMGDYEKAYQPQGHAKFCDLARLYGWGGMNDFYYYYNDRDDRGLTTAEDDDSLTLQLCKSYSKDVRPMLHFWGLHPVNATTLGTNITTLKLKRPIEIYDRIVQYKAGIPANNTAFRTFMTSWYGGQPSLTGFTVEREHAEQWSTSHGTEYNATVATRIHARVQEILDLYYPTGRPTDYQAWDANFPGIDLTIPTADADKDGLSNEAERLFGLDPTSATSSNPVGPTDTLKTAGTFTYTRRTATLSGATYTIWTTTDLTNWTQDTGATQTITATADNVQTVRVTLSAGLLSSGRRFVRVQAVVP